MSDVEEMLRNELRDLAGRPQPEPVTMLRRVRRARRRSAIAGAAMALIIVVAGAFVWLGRDPAGLPPTDPPLPSNLKNLKLPEFGTVYFPDAEQGFVLLTLCKDGTCAAWLGSTSDGGRTWQGHEVPGLTEPDTGKSWGPRVEMRVLDRSKVALDGYDRDKRWFTNDAGRTWTQLPFEPQGTVEQIPPEALARVETNGGKPIGVRILMPDGSTKLLANAPPAVITAGRSDVLFGADGSAWIQGSDDDRNYLFVSRDRGRSWAEVPVPAEAIGTGSPLLMAAGHLAIHDGRNAYLIDQYGYRVWRTTDDGRKWQVLEVPIAKPTEDIGLIAEAQPGGGLAMLDFLTQKRYVIAAGENQARPANNQAIGLAGARYVRRDGFPVPTGPLYHSADGTNWIKLPFRTG